MFLRVAATSASPSAAPCVASVPCLFGAPQPMIVLQQISDGRVSLRVAASIARLTAAGVVAVDVRHDVPAVRLETPRRVVREPAVDFAVDRNAVVVVEGDQLAEAAACPRASRLRAKCLP